MFIAQSKRKENIAEYILYLWQLEDLLRALRFEPEAIRRTMVAPHQVDPGAKEELMLWYMELVDLLRREGREQTGHLDHTMHLIADLQRLHDQLMTLPAGRDYRQLAAPLIVELPTLRATLGREDAGEVELCFRALYSVVLYRMKGDDRPRTAIESVLQLVSPVVANLVAIYHKVERGETDLYKK
ncbi:DUF4924 domain-containing protein [Bacteroidia bacterium]|nr:DUF4924 domain-containing protein [Bacteroidia bacterium]